MKLKSSRLHSRTALDRPETTTTSKLPSIAEVDWQQPLDTSANHNKLDNNHNDPVNNSTQETQGLKNLQVSDVANQSSPLKGNQPKTSVTATEQFQQGQTGNGLVPFLNRSNSSPADTHESEEHIKTTLRGDNNDPPLTITTL